MLSTLVAIGTAFIAGGQAMRLNNVEGKIPPCEIAGWLILFSALAAGQQYAARLDQRAMMRGLEVSQPHEIRQAMSPSILINLGSNSLTNIQRGHTVVVPKAVLPIDMSITFTDQGSVLIDTDFRGDGGQIVATLRGSKLQANEPGYDINSDLNGVEVVDSHRRPILQLQASGADIELGVASTYAPAAPELGAKRLWLICPLREACVTGFLGEPRSMTARASMERMFQYPTDEYRGVRCAGAQCKSADANTWPW